MNINLFGAIFFIICGLFFSFFHKIIGHYTAEFQCRLFYRLFHTHIHFSETGCQMSFLIVGIFFIIFGILMFFKII